MTDHSLRLHYDEDGWSYGVCACGWRTPPVPDTDVVADAYGDHHAETRRVAAVRVVQRAWVRLRRSVGAGRTAAVAIYLIAWSAHQ